MNDETGRGALRMPAGDEQFAGVVAHLGGNHVRLRCQDGTVRLGRIPGRMKYRTWISEGDVVLIDPWDRQDDEPTSSGATRRRTPIVSGPRATSTELPPRHGASSRRRSTVPSCPAPRSSTRRGRRVPVASRSPPVRTL